MIVSCIGLAIWESFSSILYYNIWSEVKFHYCSVPPYNNEKSILYNVGRRFSCKMDTLIYA